MESFSVNLDKLTQSEHDLLMKLVRKGSKAWKPEPSGHYFFIDGDGNVFQSRWASHSDGDGADQCRYAFGNCYPSQADAEFAVEKQKVLTELQRYADKHNEEEIDWGNDDSHKYYICYDYSEEKIDIYSNQFLQSDITYFTSSLIALMAIEAIGEGRIKKYLFNIG